MDDALKLFLTSDAPAAQDPAFVLKVLTRIEQQRFRRQVTLNIALTAAGAAVLAALVPTLDAAGAVIGRHANDVSLAIGLSLAMILFQRWMARRA